MPDVTTDIPRGGISEVSGTSETTQNALISSSLAVRDVRYSTVTHSSSGGGNTTNGRAVRLNSPNACWAARLPAPEGL